jgi:glycosyltransferase involved in cell wall biosynthesis
MDGRRPPRVSIIIPSFNRARVVSRAIESALDQDFGDLEVLVVDDGSTDDTAEVIGQLADQRVSYLRLPANMGQGHARRVGIERARGRFVALLDSDDVWLPGKLATQMTVLERHPDIDLVFTDYLNIDHRASREDSAFSLLRPSVAMLRVREVTDRVRVIEDGLPEAIMAANFIGASTVVVRQEVLVLVGSFDGRLRTAEDLELWWRLILAGATFAYVDGILSHRHKDHTSLTSAPDVTPKNSRAVALCHAAAKRAGRDDLARHVRERQYRMWYEFMGARAAQGRRGEALLEFARHVRYAATFRTCLVAGATLFGQTAIGRLPSPE